MERRKIILTDAQSKNIEELFKAKRMLYKIKNIADHKKLTPKNKLLLIQAMNYD